jgi:sugar lactone lactonase YvrE
VLLHPENTTLIGAGLDHPESVCIGPDGSIYAGGEAGQVYRIDAQGNQRLLGSTGGFLLGIAIDAAGRIHACDCAQSQIVRIDPDGSMAPRSTGSPSRQFSVPNFPVFDPQGNLFVSESGDYWERKQGTGCIMKVAPDNTTTIFHAGPLLFANGLAMDATGQWLYIVQSTAPNVVRIPLDRPNGPVEVTHTLPTGTVPDGLALASDGRLVIACYKPDGAYLGHPDGTVELLCEDVTGELLSRPTNVAIRDGQLLFANLGGWHLTAVATDMQPAPIHRPHLP